MVMWISLRYCTSSYIKAKQILRISVIRDVCALVWAFRGARERVRRHTVADAAGSECPRSTRESRTCQCSEIGRLCKIDPVPEIGDVSIATSTTTSTNSPICFCRSRLCNSGR